MQVVKPPKLRSGDTIGVVSTSFPFPNDKSSSYHNKYLMGKHELEKMGFNVAEGKNLGKVYWWAGGTPQERAADINAMYRDTRVKAIISHDGGQGAIALLPYLDYECIKSNPKPFIGFSDITNILSAIFVKTGQVGFHMGLLTYELGGYWQLSSEADQDLGRHLFKSILTETEPLGEIKPRSKWSTLRDGAATGKLFGGNLSMLAALVGTTYFPNIEDLRGSILFWETDNVRSYIIERNLLQLKYPGVFDVISGMVIGKLVDIKSSVFEDMGMHEPSPHEIVMETLRDTSFPVLGDVDFGHKMINTPMPVGVLAAVDASNKKLTFLESAVI